LSGSRHASARPARVRRGQLAAGLDLRQVPHQRPAAAQALVGAQALGDRQHVALQIAEQDVLPCRQHAAQPRRHRREEARPGGQRQERRDIMFPRTARSSPCARDGSRARWPAGRATGRTPAARRYHALGLAHLPLRPSTERRLRRVVERPLAEVGDQRVGAVAFDAVEAVLRLRVAERFTEDRTAHERDEHVALRPRNATSTGPPMLSPSWNAFGGNPVAYVLTIQEPAQDPAGHRLATNAKTRGGPFGQPRVLLGSGALCTPSNVPCLGFVAALAQRRRNNPRSTTPR
jgi:hypothetical protein